MAMPFPVRIENRRLVRDLDVFTELRDDRFVPLSVYEFGSFFFIHGVDRCWFGARALGIFSEAWMNWQ
jgi:hypothetical protein